MARLQLPGYIYRGANHGVSGLCTLETTRQQCAKIKTYLHARPPARPHRHAPACCRDPLVSQRPYHVIYMQNARQATHRLQDRYMHSLAIESIPNRA